MSRRFFYALILILLFVVLAKPGATWKELRRMWRDRSWMLTVMVVLIGIYFIYGLLRWLNQ